MQIYIDKILRAIMARVDNSKSYDRRSENENKHRDGLVKLCTGFHQGRCKKAVEEESKSQETPGSWRRTRR